LAHIYHINWKRCEITSFFTNWSRTYQPIIRNTNIISWNDTTRGAERHGRNNAGRGARLTMPLLWRENCRRIHINSIQRWICSVDGHWSKRESASSSTGKARRSGIPMAAAVVIRGPKAGKWVAQSMRKSGKGSAAIQRWCRQRTATRARRNRGGKDGLWAEWAEREEWGQRSVGPLFISVVARRSLTSWQYYIFQCLNN
jgi:hypothetical protein